VDPGLDVGGEVPKAPMGERSGRGAPSQPTIWGLGERRKLPHRVLGRSPGRKRILVSFELEKTHLMLRNLIIFELIHACNCK